MPKPQYKNLLHNILTDYDNHTFDTGRVIAFLYFLSSICFEGYHLFKAPELFRVQEYLVGGAAFLAGLGAYILGDNKGRPKEGVNTNAISTDLDVPKK